MQCLHDTLADTRTTEDFNSIQRATLDHHIRSIGGGLAMTRILESLCDTPPGVKTTQEFANAID